MPSLAGYVRVSFVGARSGDAFRSPTDQIAEIEAWARSRGYRVTMLPPELDAKGSDAARPIFRQAIEGVKRGTYDGVVVAYLSRAGRDLRLMLDLWAEVEAAGGTVFSARENIDGSTAAGRLHRNLLASIGQHELEERREGFERAAASATERGIWQRRQTPRGYERDPETRRLVPNADADSIGESARAFLAGTSIVELSRRLGMSPSGVRAMLRNRVYLGELRSRGYLNAAAHPPLLDIDTFDAVQAKLASRVRPTRRADGPALLAGLARCASCGHVMTRGVSKGAGIYKCPRHHSGAECPTPTQIAVARLDPHVEEVALAELARLRITASASDTVADARAAVAAAERELAAYLDAVDAAGLGAEDAAAGMRRRNTILTEAREVLRVELARAPIVPRIGGGAEVWGSLSRHERNELLRGLLAAVVVRPVGRGKTVPIAERVRVLRYGADLALPGGRGGAAAGIVPIWPDAHGIDVLGISRAEDAL